MLSPGSGQGRTCGVVGELAEANICGEKRGEVGSFFHFLTYFKADMNIVLSGRFRYLSCHSVFVLSQFITVQYFRTFKGCTEHDFSKRKFGKAIYFKSISSHTPNAH